MCDIIQHLILTNPQISFKKRKALKNQDALGNATNLTRKCERPKVYDTF
jgi:hypothetical protein